jgi:hypothetical protein
LIAGEVGGDLRRQNVRQQLLGTHATDRRWASSCRAVD